MIFFPVPACPLPGGKRGTWRRERPDRRRKRLFRAAGTAPPASIAARDGGGETPFRGPGLPKDLDLRVHDRAALDETELYAEVLSAVAAADGPLTAAEIDNVLGVRRRRPSRAGARRRTRTAPPIGTRDSAKGRARGESERPVQSHVSDSADEPGPEAERGSAVSPAELYRQARRQAAAEQPSFDMRSGLEKLDRWMAGDAGEAED
ncbi:hypothetical protein [Actinomadura montaniterrae]|uniref:hypothetical protein n=1 Tax=Actinomadura montaniterrae TaxID=1803903 RepID=UPI001CEF9BE2|nr:hypothetical protein [Actinomadura montaniterrae]